MWDGLHSPHQIQDKSDPVSGNSSELGAVLPRPHYDVDVGHGHTLKEINGLAVHAAKLCNWVNGMELTDRAVSAWSAIAEHL